MATRPTHAPATTNAGSRKRADAVRNREAIVAAAVRTLRADPEASVAQIAQAAGVGRVTLYGHFATRAELVDTALADVLDRGNAALAELDLGGDPRAALATLVASSWQLLDESRALLIAAQRELPLGRIRDQHQEIEARVRSLLERGQSQGVFRDDLPVSWLLTTMHALMHAAAEEITADRLDPADAPRLLEATLLPAFARTDAGASRIGDHA